MAVMRVSALRHTLGHGLRPAVQRRWAQVHDVRFLATHQEADRVMAKYKDKLERKARELGVKDIEGLKDVFRKPAPQHSVSSGSSIASASASASASPLPGSASASALAASSTESPFPQPPPAPRIATDAPAKPASSTPPGVRTLSSFLDVSKVLDLPSKEIEQIWRLRHAKNSNSLCAAIPTPLYRHMEMTARRHPQFILPLPRQVPANDTTTPTTKTAAEIHFLQWTFPAPDTATVLFTHLAEYKLRGEFSVPHTTVTHHLELAAPKGLVLLQGAVTEGRGVTADEARWLLLCLQRFYAAGHNTQNTAAGPNAGDQAIRRELLQRFSTGDGAFRVEQLLEEAEKIV